MKGWEQTELSLRFPLLLFTFDSGKRFKKGKEKEREKERGREREGEGKGERCSQMQSHIEEKIII